MTKRSNQPCLAAGRQQAVQYGGQFGLARTPGFGEDRTQLISNSRNAAAGLCRHRLEALALSDATCQECLRVRQVEQKLQHGRVTHFGADPCNNQDGSGVGEDVAC